MQKILNTLDALDSHNFERIDPNNSIDTLYNNIFPPIPEKQTNINSAHVNTNGRFTNKLSVANNQADDNKKDYVRIMINLITKLLSFYQLLSNS